jgi:uncharacterized membrane protein
MRGNVNIIISSYLTAKMVELRLHGQYYDYYDPNYGYSSGGGGISIGALIIIFVVVFILVFVGIMLYRRYRAGQMGGGMASPAPVYGAPPPGYMR